MLSDDGRLPLHARLKDDLVHRIETGEWRADEPLPPESVLVTEYDVSMGTLRRVLAELVAEGMVERHQGRGTFVRRLSLERSMFRFFRGGTGQEGEPIGRILERTVVTAPADVADRLGVARGADVGRLERVRCWGEDPFLFEVIWIPLPRLQEIVSAPLDALGNLLYPAYERLCDVTVARATEELSVTAADATAAEVLGCAPGESLIRICRTARTHTRAVVEYRESVGLTDHFTYRVEIN